MLSTFWALTKGTMESNVANNTMNFLLMIIDSL